MTPSKITTKRPGCLSSTPGVDVLADGSFVLHVSHQLKWVYVRILTTDGHFRTRRYRRDSQIKVQS
ncbi:MAG TPA: hypothetical protein VFH54_18190 [Mycobacteriales bacterium]|nr:hypothetical protein [Mycobacteriales bacterium]